MMSVGLSARAVGCRELDIFYQATLNGQEGSGCAEILRYWTKVQYTRSALL